MRLTSLLAVTASLFALGAPFDATAASAQSAQPSARTSEPSFNAQARAEGLSAAEARRLQTRVDRIVKRTGGRQIALNQIAWAGGDTLVPLPGERRARDLGQTRASGTVRGCQYLQFCTYSSAHYTGVVDRMSSCTWHKSHAFFRSYVNNQTAGTRARLYRGDRKLLTRTRPALSQGTTSYGAAFYIRPC